MSGNNLQSLSPGRWRGLRKTSTEEGSFAILAFDQRGNYRRLIGDDVSFETATRVKREVVEGLMSCVSGVLLDFVYGYDAAMQVGGSSGLLLAVEKTGYSGEPNRRHTELPEGWGPDKVKRFGASAAKLLVYYNPTIEDLAEEIERLVGNIADQCRALDLPLFVEPISYSATEDVDKGSAEFAAIRPEIVRQTAERLSACGPDALKLEFPVDVHHDVNHQHWASACERVTEACTCPWTLLSAGVDFEDYLAQYEVAAASGASGFVAGRAIWKECVTMNPAERSDFLESTARPRLQKLSEITARSAARLTDYFKSDEAEEHWYRSYPNLCSS